MLKYFRHYSVFFDFRTTRCVVVVREVADREVVDREVEEYPSTQNRGRSSVTGRTHFLWAWYEGGEDTKILTFVLIGFGLCCIITFIAGVLNSLNLIKGSSHKYQNFITPFLLFVAV